jgi:hypothetical protein
MWKAEKKKEGEEAEGLLIDNRLNIPQELVVYIPAFLHYFIELLLICRHSSAAIF